MERIVESEHEATEIEVEFEDEEEELEFVVPWTDEEQKDDSLSNRRLYGQTFGGFIAIAALLIVSMVTLPGMLVLVLFAEIYLMDWTYSKVNLLRNVKSAPSAGLKGRQDRARENDQKNPGTSPKDQFVK